MRIEDGGVAREGQAEEVLPGSASDAWRPRLMPASRSTSASPQVAASLVLVAIAILASRWRDAGLERDIAIAVARSFVQLTAIGFVINFIFEQDDAGLVIALLAVMVVFGALTARNRAESVPGAFWPLLVALALRRSRRSGSCVALGIFEPEPRYVVPVGGMVIGNAMTAAAVALNRLGEDVHDRAHEIEATAGAGGDLHPGRRPAGQPQPALGDDHPDRLDEDDGADLLPGDDGGDAARGRRSRRRRAPAADPALRAARPVAIAALTATTLARRNFFTPAHQLREPPEP